MCKNGERWSCAVEGCPNTTGCMYEDWCDEHRIRFEDDE